MRNTHRLWGPGSLRPSHRAALPMQPASGHRHHGNEWVRPGSNKTLFSKQRREAGLGPPAVVGGSSVPLFRTLQQLPVPAESDPAPDSSSKELQGRWVPQGHAKRLPASRPLHWLLPQPRTLSGPLLTVPWLTNPIIEVSQRPFFQPSEVTVGSLPTCFLKCMMYLFLAVLGLRCCPGFSLGVVRGILTERASLLAEHRLPQPWLPASGAQAQGCAARA